MRVSGKLTSWQDDRGFGFISPTQGGEDVFLHIKAFPRNSGRPQVGEVLTFETAPGPHGRKRAVQVQRSGAAAPTFRQRGGAALHHRISGLLSVVACLGIYWGVDQLWGIPVEAALCALSMAALSLVSFALYSTDKFAARNGHARVPEFLLHLLALVGGWPGAMLAQKMFHHKIAKPAFMTVFRRTVLVNVLLLAGLAALWFFAWPFA